MDTQTSAKLAEMSYDLGRASKKDIPDTIDTINEHLQDENINYEVVPEWSDRQVITYRNLDDPNKIHISHKGTQVGSSTQNRDLLADLKIAFGFSPHDRYVKKRKKRTERIIDNLNPDELTMSSHSLGGMTQNYTVAKSKKVRDVLLQGDTFNAGSSPLFNNDLKIGKKTKTQLNKIPLRHHRTKRDIVSAGLVDNLPFGELVEYKTRANNHEKEHKKIDEGFYEKQNIKTKKELQKMGYLERGIYDHHIHHFSDRIIDPIQKHKNTKNKKLNKKNMFSFIPFL